MAIPATDREAIDKIRPFASEALDWDLDDGLFACGIASLWKYIFYFSVLFLILKEIINNLTFSFLKVFKFFFFDLFFMLF